MYGSNLFNVRNEAGTAEEESIVEDALGVEGASVPEDVSDFADFFKSATQGNPLLGSGVILSGDIFRDMYDNDIPDTKEGTIFLALAYTSASNPVTSIRWKINRWSAITITSKFPRKFDVEKGEGQGTIKRGDNTMNGLEPKWVPANGDAGDYGMYNSSCIELCPDPESREMFNTIYGGQNDWKQFYIDFLNAYQTNSLKEKNVDSYMKWNKIDDVEGVYIAKHFGKVAGGAPTISNSEGMRALLRKGKWTTYRSTFATITGVVQRMFNELPSGYMVLFSSDTRNIVRYAIENPHSEDAFRLIPDMVLAYAYVWNLVTELDLPGLYSGKKVYEDLPYNQRMSMMNVLKEAKSKIAVWSSHQFSDINKLPRALRDV